MLYQNADLGETTNLVENSQYANTVQNMYKRLLEIGPCPKDKQGDFLLQSEGRNVRCNYFWNDPSQCENHIEGKLYCNSVCANNHNRELCGVTHFPPAVSSPPCQDSKKRLNVHGERDWHNCKQVSRNRHLCYEDNLAKMKCPVACKQACVPYDSQGTFKYKGQLRSCKWVRSRKYKRCKQWKLQANCPVTCTKHLK